mgnify:CR=1 FL=1
MNKKSEVSRRKFLKVGSVGVATLLGSTYLGSLFSAQNTVKAMDKHEMHNNLKNQLHEGMKHGFEPSLEKTEGFLMAQKALTTFDYGRVSILPNGQTLREYEIRARETNVEISKGITFPGWTFNETIPGPTIRCTEGDLLRIKFINITGHPHSIHFHGMHPTNMDGLEAIMPGGEFTYEFEAKPAGMHVYHCHVAPLARHIHKGLYGNFIIDPKKKRAKATEFNMVMNGFDLDLDGENEIYTVNGYAFAYLQEPIRVKTGELVRIYLSNLTEFDVINSFHLHANFFNYYATGADPEARPNFTDTIMQCQGERGILEIVFPSPGKYMFHAHQSEFAELGWMGFFLAE